MNPFFDYCSKCNKEHSYMSGPCTSCGGSKFRGQAMAKSKRTDEVVSESSRELTSRSLSVEEKAEEIRSLVDQYWILNKEKAEAARKLNAIKDQLIDKLALTKGKLTKDEYKNFDVQSILVEDQNATSISNFVQMREYPDWDYIEARLTKYQLRKAKKKVYVAALKLTAQVKHAGTRTLSEDEDSDD